ncbi:MAG: hypothetical protein WBM86_11025 [Waterburya sp.]
MQASVALDDQFEARYACQAFQSIRKRTNPEDIRLTPGDTYPVTAKNKPDETYYYLTIEDAKPQQRWVDISCGKLLGDSDGGVAPISNSDNLLAISWQPAFCETHQNKTECETQTTERFDASNFTLHGLWPQPRGNDYCNVSSDIKALDKNKKWSEMPPISLSDELFQELKQKMPGVASDLHLHEWYKHGTCYSETPEEYYRESLTLLDQVNNSEVRELFASNLGMIVTSDEILTEFDQAFGNDAGNKVAISCATDNQPTNRRMIGELKLNLKGDIDSDTTMTELFEQGKTVKSRNVCSAGEIDPAGFN